MEYCVIKMRCVKTFGRIGIVFLFIMWSPYEASARVIPQIGLAGSFFSIKGKQGAARYSVGSKSSYIFRPAIAFVSEESGLSLSLIGHLQRAQLETTGLTVSRTSAFLFGFGPLLVVPVDSWFLNFGARWKQALLLGTTTTTIQVEPANQGEVSLGADVKLVALERRLVTMGLELKYLLPSQAASLKSQGGYGADASIHLHLRGTVQYTIFATGSFSSLSMSGSGTQSTSEFLLGLQISFPGRYGLKPPKDELEK